MINSPLLASIPEILHGFGIRSITDPLPNVVTVKQVHGTYLLFIDGNREIEKPGYDILMTDKPKTAIGIKTADCLPILMVEPEKRIVVAAHAGWKGTLAGIAKTVCSEITKRGGEINNLALCLGPSISGNCYEVGIDVASQFEKKFQDSSEFLKRKSENKWLLDIPEANRHQFLELGIRPERIDRIDLCTHCRPDLFHSYRRDGAEAGRMVNFIQIVSE